MLLVLDKRHGFKPYIDLNTELRKNTKNEIEKDFYKLKINSISGKTVQNDRKHRDIKLVTAELIYGDKIRLCYTDTDSFIMQVKTDDFYKDISADVDKWFDTSNFNKNDNRSLESGKNEKVLGKFKGEIGVALRAKTYSFLIDEYTDEDYEKSK